VATGSGWSAESSLAENTVEDGTRTKTFENTNIGFVQGFAAFGGRVTAAEFTVDTLPASGTTNWILEILNGSTVLGSTRFDLVSGLNRVDLEPPVTITAAMTTYFRVRSEWVGTIGARTIGVAYSNGDYAGGALTWLFGASTTAGDDLTFKVYGQTQLGFNSTVGVQATSSESSKTAQVDYLVRVPTDEGYACITRDFAAAQGIVIDESAPLPQKHNIYLADADGIGPSVLAQASEWRGSLMLRPGYNLYTVAAYTPVGAAPGGGTVWAWYRPRYLTCGS